MAGQRFEIDPDLLGVVGLLLVRNRRMVAQYHIEGKVSQVAANSQAVASTAVVCLIH